MHTLSESYQADLARAKAQVDEREALEVARLAAHLVPCNAAGLAVYPGTPEADREQVRRARALLAEARKQTNDARAERERS